MPYQGAIYYANINANNQGDKSYKIQYTADYGGALNLLIFFKRLLT